MLERRSLGEVLALLRRVPVCSSGNCVLCDGAGWIAGVELTSEAPARGRTVASLIAEPAAGRLHVARGNPCQAAYAVYDLGRE